MSNQQKKEDNIGLADAITKSILSTGRIDLHRKLFCSMQLIGGVALTAGLISAVEERFEIVAFYSQDFSTLLAFMLMFDRLILQKNK
ncbi:putative ATPase, nucleotide binding domain-containing protein [Helianthus annuus]|nr:putative ATPase, nucleotide binding domain-containing protein [Helianthus annuus]